MKNRPKLSASRAVEDWNEMLWARRELYTDSEFFKMPEAWARICGERSSWSINAYRSNKIEHHKPRAGVVMFDDCLILTVDERLMEQARQGCGLSNFILAHELGHVALDHHARHAVTKNFQLFVGPSGKANLPPTLEELEANYAAVFFQCGVALLDPKWDPVDLARRAFSDVDYVRKAQAIVRLEAFQRELNRPKPKRERVIL